MLGLGEKPANSGHFEMLLWKFPDGNFLILGMVCHVQAFDLSFAGFCYLMVTRVLTSRKIPEVFPKILMIFQDRTLPGPFQIESRRCSYGNLGCLTEYLLLEWNKAKCWELEFSLTFHLLWLFRSVPWISEGYSKSTRCEKLIGFDDLTVSAKWRSVSFSSIPFLSQLLRFSASMRWLAKHAAKILDAHWSMLVIGPSGHPTTFAEEIPGTHCERYGRGEMGETGREQLGIGLHHIVSKLQASHHPIHLWGKFALQCWGNVSWNQARAVTWGQGALQAMRPKKTACWCPTCP